ncbi:MAG: glutamine-hydrolyzing GMP synthase [Promethearchaeota archaeon]|jgi:GMP synthase (glutamine-hydrolysing)
MDTILILDFGGQYCHLIARRIRDLGVYSEILPFNIALEEIKVINPKGIILSGGPNSVYENGSPQLSAEFFKYVSEGDIPVLGICYGHHLIAHHFKGKIESYDHREYGQSELKTLDDKGLLKGLNEIETVWMSHGDHIKELPEGFSTLASTETCPIAAYKNDQKNLFGVQFHPEVVHTPKGNILLENFVSEFAKAKKEWKFENWIEKTIQNIKETVGPNNRVILGLSGGVDSTVAATLIHRAIGVRLHSIFVNNGVLRKNEVNQVQESFKDKLKFKNFNYVDAEDLFLNKLNGVEDPEEKRRIIGHTFIEVFEKKTVELEKEHPDIKFLAQGTIYPDRVETSATSNNTAKIKSHHNLTLPDDMMLEVLEPLKDLYKDEVRKIGVKLGLPKDLINRHPFPGPGLAVRIIGSIDRAKLDILRDADEILIEEIRMAGVYDSLWQAFCVFLPIKTVGIMGDYRTYENICAIRAVESLDTMTANFAKLDMNLLEKIGTRIINEVKGINRVVYDISNKPPSTIEYE